MERVEEIRQQSFIKRSSAGKLAKAQKEARGKAGTEDDYLYR